MRLAWLVVAAACGRKAEVPPTAGSTPAPVPPGSGSAPAPAAAWVPAPAGPAACRELPFAETSPVPEASGAAWIDAALVVAGDSGTRGAYAIVDPETGATREQGKLPLAGGGGAGRGPDDLEGLAARGDRLFGISSAGWIREWRRTSGGFALVAGPYPLGPIDLPDRDGGFGARPPEGTGMVCPERANNCGRNYEGLCLAPAASARPRGAGAARCTGFAASKADGHLYCLVERDGKLAVVRDRAIRITRPGVIADCAFSDAGTLYVGSNAFDAGRVYRVAGWEDPAHARVDVLGELPVGFPETLAARGDVVYRMSDTGGSPSWMKKYRCP